MQTLNEDEMFSPIKSKIENGELKTANNLRILLEALAEKHNVSTLNMLCFFRAWLVEHRLDLSTTYGEVTLSPIT